MSDLKNIQKLFLLVIFCIPLYLVKIDIFGLPSNVFEILASIAILLLLIQEKQLIFKKIYSLPKTFLLSTLLLLVGVFLSTIFNQDLKTGFGIIKSWFLLPIVFSFGLYVITNSLSDIKKIFISVYFSALTIGLIAIFYKLFGIVTYDNRLSAFFTSPNYLAMYLSSGFFFGFVLFKSSSLKLSYFSFATLFIILIPLYYTFSYGAWLAVFISIALVAMFSSNFKKYLTLKLALATIFIFGLFFSQIHSEKFSAALTFSPRSSAVSRLMIWNSSVLLIQENPIFGVGPGNFQTAYLANQKYFPPYLEWAVPQPHNLFLAFWLQTGIIGFIGFVLLLCSIFQMLWQLLSNKKSAAFAAPLAGFFLYTILHGLVDTTYWKNDLSFFFWISTFLVMKLHLLHQEKNHS